MFCVDLVATIVSEKRKRTSQCDTMHTQSCMRTTLYNIVYSIIFYLKHWRVTHKKYVHTYVICSQLCTYLVIFICDCL